MMKLPNSVATTVGILEGHYDPNIPQILPHDRMYNIQIGTKLFKISGASLSSDGPSYFTNYFIKKEMEMEQHLSSSTGSTNTSSTGAMIQNNPNNLSLNSPARNNSVNTISGSTGLNNIISNSANNNTSNNTSNISNINVNNTTAFDSSGELTTNNLSSQGSPASIVSYNSSSRGFAHKNKDILFIDRSPDIFELIYKHLQGYFIDIKNEVEYTMLVADSVYYNLPRLKMLLKKSEYYYTRIADKSYKIAKDLFSRDGDQFNYFQITFDTLYIDIENLMIAKRLLRPPPHSYAFIGRSPQYFDMLLALLTGATLDLTDALRDSLIKECKFYRFLNLEQRLVPVRLNYNPLTENDEIIVELKYIVKRQLTIPDVNELSGEMLNKPFINHICQMLTVSSPAYFNNDVTNESLIMPGATPGNDNLLNLLKDDYIDFSGITTKRPKLSNDTGSTNSQSAAQGNRGNSTNNIVNTATDSSNIINGRLTTKLWRFVHYKRPYLDEINRELCFQINTNECVLIFNKLTRSIYLDIVGSTMKSFINTFAYILKKQNIELIDYRYTIPDLANDKKQVDHILIPVCLSLCDLFVHNERYSGNMTDFFDDGMENVLDVRNMTKTQPIYTTGKLLYLKKSIWKMALDENNNLVLMGVKLDSFRDFRQFCNSIEFL